MALCEKLARYWGPSSVLPCVGSNPLGASTNPSPDGQYPFLIFCICKDSMSLSQYQDQGLMLYHVSSDLFHNY